MIEQEFKEWFKGGQVIKISKLVGYDSIIAIIKNSAGYDVVVYEKTDNEYELLKFRMEESYIQYQNIKEANKIYTKVKKGYK